jgi:SAM-dependent methyltransferase
LLHRPFYSPQVFETCTTASSLSLQRYCSFLRFSEKTYSSRNPFLRCYFWSRLTRSVEVMESCNPLFALDIGCGKGELLTILAEKFAGSECVGIDIGSDLSVAKQKAAVAHLQNVQFIRADCMLLPFRSESLELVFCSSVLEHLLDALPAVLEIERILLSGGKAIVGIPTENRMYQILRAIAGLRKPKDHYHQGTQLEELLLDRFGNAEPFILPFSWLPRFLSLYIILLCSKEFAGNTPAAKNDNEHCPAR